MILAAPLFLIGLVAVGIPIAIHLLQLRRYHKVYFSNVDMLEELHNESRKQSNLRRLLILAARILAIVFLVLAFCQPVIPSKHSQLQTGGTAVSVYVDNSYSMECGGMDGSLIESARAKAREIAQAYQPGDQFQLITNDCAGSQFHWLSREEFLSAVDEVAVTAVTANMSAIIGRQQEFLTHSTAANKHAYAISDFQRATTDIQRCVVDSSVQLVLIPLEGSDVANVFIDSLSFDCPAYFRGAVVKAVVSVKNMGDKGVESLPLRLFVGDKQRALASVDIAAHGTSSATMTFTIDDEHALQGYVETTDYPITFDDKLYFSLPIMRQLPMIVIDGVGENVSLQRLFKGDSLVKYEHQPVAQIDYAHLAEHQFVVLNELQSIPSGLAQTLQEFVMAGGSLLVVPGENVEVASYNQLLSAMRAPQLGAWVTRQTRAQEVVLDHELFRGVFQKKQQDMELPSVTGYYRLSSSASTVGQSVIRLVDGGDYLVSMPVGEGRCYLFASPLRKEHTDMVQQALFVPTVYNMALFSTPLSSPYHALSGNEPIALRGKYDAEVLPHLRGDDGRVDVIPDIRRIGTRQVMLPHGEVVAAGNYLLEASDGAKDSEGLSFNYSRDESDLSYYSRDEVKHLVSDAGLANCSVVPTAKKSVTDYIRQRSQGTPLWRLFVIMALVALLAETLLIRMPQKTMKNASDR